MTAQLTVIGGGPAGLAAAAAAGAAGLSTVLVDENEVLGGQYLRQPRGARAPAAGPARRGAEAIEAIRRARVAALAPATAFAVAGGRVEVEVAGRRRTLASPVLLAPGATERVVPLPGWTLPGVVTCGGAQALLKMHGEPIGRRVLVAGSGPFLLPVAAALIAAGAGVAAVLEAGRLGRRAVAASLTSPGVAAEAAGHLWALARARVRLRTGWAVTEITEVAGGLAARIARLDASGRVVPGTAEVVRCDAVCLSDGFLPSVELADLAGAQVRFLPGARAWAVAADPLTGATSAPGVWAAGACTDPWAGARLSATMGAAAGAAAADALAGRLPARGRAPGERARTLARRLDRAFPTRAAWYQRTTDDVIVCRCENIDAGAIRAAAAESPDVNAVKRATRAGMGLCQGRTCQAAVAELTSAVSGLPLERVGRFTARSPVRPTRLGTLAGDG